MGFASLSGPEIAKFSSFLPRNEEKGRSTMSLSDPLELVPWLSPVPRLSRL